ncbi:MAG TPA: hypothetical protein VGL11_02530 [Candidatus Binatia bacterium]|jgi:hypothetical protein
MKAKKFDCVAMMHKGAAEVRKKIRGMKKRDEIAFWQESSQRLKQRQRKANRKENPSGQIQE